MATPILRGGSDLNPAEYTNNQVAGGALEIKGGRKGKSKRGGGTCGASSTAGLVGGSRRRTHKARRRHHRTKSYRKGSVKKRGKKTLRRRK